MKSWLKTGFMAVGIYVFIFLFNYTFVRSVDEDLIIQTVTAPVYILLSMFGIVSFGVFFVAGTVFYFAVGILIDVLGNWVGKFYHRFS